MVLRVGFLESLSYTEVFEGLKHFKGRFNEAGSPSQV